MSVAEQLALIDSPVTLAEQITPPDNNGEVFTRRWVADLVLDLAGYRAERDLGASLLVEPSCGTGAFLVPTVERLLASADDHGHPASALTGSIRAFDLVEENVAAARARVAGVLGAHRIDALTARRLAESWITCADFLLTDHENLSADYVVGNPPYVRLEDVPGPRREAYRRRCATMRGRADLYVGFIETGLGLLGPDGVLAYICADRWMRNSYGADLRALVTSAYAVDIVVSMHDVDAFENDVAAYPAIVVLRNGPQRDAAVVDTDGTFTDADVPALNTWLGEGVRDDAGRAGYDATRVQGWFAGRDLWPTGSPKDLARIADLESRFPPLEDPMTGTRVGIGVATGCDDVFITEDPNLVEPDRLVRLLQAPDTKHGKIDWAGRYLVNPWDGAGLVSLTDHPRLADYFATHAERINARYVAKQRPHAWYRTIDRVDATLTTQPKLVIPDMKAAANPVLDEGSYYPHHNLYYVVSDVWDLQILGGLLLSDIANLFVGAYCVRMRGGTYRFQAQYLRRIRVPDPASIPAPTGRALAEAFVDRDVERASGLAAQVYGLASRSV